MSESYRESRQENQAWSSSQLLDQSTSVKKSPATFHPALDAKKEFPTRKIATIVVIVLVISICIAAALVPIYISFGYEEADIDSYFDFNTVKDDSKLIRRPTSPDMVPSSMSNFQIPPMMPLPPPSEQIAPLQPPLDFQQPSQPINNSTMLKKLRKSKLHRHKRPSKESLI